MKYNNNITDIRNMSYYSYMHSMLECKLCNKQINEKRKEILWNICILFIGIDSVCVLMIFIVFSILAQPTSLHNLHPCTQSKICDQWTFTKYHTV